MPIAVVVKLDDYKGPSINDNSPSCVPTYVTVTANSDNGIIEKQQLPLRPAWALIIHKSQGLILPKAWIDIGKSERAPRAAYVAISRVKRLSDCVLELMTFQRLTSLKQSASLKFRLDKEQRLKRLANTTYGAFH